MEISEIKSRLTLSEVLSHYGLKPDKNLRLHCPFHEDRTPSLQVYYKTHTAYCFSSNCRTHGKSLDVIDFVMHKENCTKAEAIKKAELMANGQLSVNNDNGEKPTVNHSALAIPRAQILGNIFVYLRRLNKKTVNFMEQIKYHQMDIAVKYRIISEIINSNDERVLNAVKSLLNIEDEVDFWEGLSAEDRAALDEGLEQLDKGQHVSHESVREEIKNRFNF